MSLSAPMISIATRPRSSTACGCTDKLLYSILSRQMKYRDKLIATSRPRETPQDVVRHSNDSWLETCGGSCLRSPILSRQSPTPTPVLMRSPTSNDSWLEKLWWILYEEPYHESSESASDTGVAEDSDYDSGLYADPGIGRGPSPLSSSVSSQCRPEDCCAADARA